MFKTFNLKKAIIAVVVTFAAGALAYLFSKSAMQDYMNLTLPPFSPPSWLFGIVWPVLYLLMSISLYLVSNTDAEQTKKSFSYILYGLQLVLNVLWTPLFFVFGLYVTSAVLLAVLVIISIAVFIMFYRINKTAGYIFIPYVLWLLFALYLNIGTAILN